MQCLLCIYIFFITVLRQGLPSIPSHHQCCKWLDTATRIRGFAVSVTVVLFYTADATARIVVTAGASGIVLEMRHRRAQPAQLYPPSPIRSALQCTRDCSFYKKTKCVITKPKFTPLKKNNDREWAAAETIRFTLTWVS